MAPYRILFLAPSMQGKGGVTEFCRMLVANLGPEFEADHQTIANRPGNQSPLKRVGHFFGDYLRLRKKLRGSQYSLCHLNPSFRILALLRDGFYLRLIHKFYRGRILVTFHGWDGRLLTKINKNYFLRTLLKKWIGKARMILVLSGKFKSQLEEVGYPPENIRVITTMFEGDFADRKRAGESSSPRTNLVFVSRFIKCKGAHIAAEAVKRLVDEGRKDIHATFAGDGPEFEGIRDFIEKNGLSEVIGMPGFVRDEEKRKIFEEGDIFLFPTYCQEGCPIVLLEAMGAGMAVVSTPVGAIPEIMEHNKNGFLVESQDPGDFCAKLRELLENPDLLRKFQQQNKEAAEEKYRASAVTRKIESLYHEIMDGYKVAA